MKYYIYNGTFIAVPSRSDELYHYGVPGMKWGVRKQRETVSVGGTSRRTFGGAPTNTGARTARQSSGQRQKTGGKIDRNSPEVKAARAAKAKKALKIGAAVAGTALAAYGTYKLAQYMQGKRSQMAMAKAQDYIDQNVYRKVRDTKFTDGTRELDFRTKSGKRIVGDVSKAVGQRNAQVVAESKQIYKNATNTKLDKALAKVVNTGDKVKSTANKAKNKVLDVVNPKYEYTPKVSTKTWRDDNGIDWTETVTDYIKTQKKRI